MWNKSALFRAVSKQLSWNKHNQIDRKLLKKMRSENRFFIDFAWRLYDAKVFQPTYMAQAINYSSSGTASSAQLNESIEYTVGIKIILLSAAYLFFTVSLQIWGPISYMQLNFNLTWNPLQLEGWQMKK